MASGRRSWRASVSKTGSWTVVDQAISSVSNFVFVVSVARSVSAETFGAFSLAYLAYGLLLGAGRAVGGELLLLRATENDHSVERDSRRLLGVMLSAGVGVAPILLLVAVVVEGPASGCFGALALALPILLAQDALRYCYFARKAPKGAAANDAVWLVVQLTALAGLWLSDSKPTAPVLIAAWGAGAVVALGVGMWHARVVPALRGVSRWVSEDLPRVSSFLADFALTYGSIYLALYVVVLIGSTQDLGAVRGGLLLYAPIDTVVAGVRILSLPALARSLAAGRDAIRARARRYVLVYVSVVAGWSMLVIATPDRIGEAILGRTWPLAEPLLPALALACAGRYAVLPALDGIRVHGGGRQLVSMRVLTTALTFSAVTVGTILGGALGVAIALAVAYAFEAGLWWRSFARRNRG